MKKNKKILITLSIIFIIILSIVLNYNKNNIKDFYVAYTTRIKYKDNNKDGISLALTTTGFNYDTSDKTYKYDFTEEKQNVMQKVQLNFKIDPQEKSIQPGDIIIKIDNPNDMYYKHDYTYGENRNNVMSISADVEGGENTEKNKFTYRIIDGTWNSTTMKFEGGYILLTNDTEFEANTAYEESISIVVNALADNVINNDGMSITAELNGDKSNTLKFKATTLANQYDVETIASKIKDTKLFDNDENYIWVKYSLYAKQKTGVLPPVNSYFEVQLPDDVVVYGNDNKLMSKTEDRYIVDRTKITSYYDIDSFTSFIYVGYPVETYKDQSTNMTLNAYAEFYNSRNEYWGFKIKDYDKSNIKNIGDYNMEINVNDFIIDKNELEYTFFVNGDWAYQSLTYDTITDENYEASVTYTIGGTADYSGKETRVRIYDDVVGLINNDGWFEKLNDEEYYFSFVGIPKLYNKNDEEISDDVVLSLYVRREGESEYEQYGDSFKPYKEAGFNYFRFKPEEKIVAYYVQIDNLKESFKLEGLSLDNRIYTKINIKRSKNISPTGGVYNFGGMEVYNKIDDNYILISEPTEYSTKTYMKDLEKSDLNVYGRRMIRDTYKVDYQGSRVAVGNELSIKEIKNNPDEEKFNIKWNTQLKVTGGSTYKEFDKLNIYMVLPEGMELESDLDDIKNSIAFTYKEELGKTYDELKKMFNENASLEIIKNYRNSNRTYIKITYDLKDDSYPLLKFSNTLPSGYGQTYMSFGFSTKVTYDDYREFGDKYKLNILYEMINDGKRAAAYEYYCVSDDGSYYNDPVISDINNNGDTKEYLSHMTNTATIVGAIASSQSLNAKVKTSNNNYTTNESSVGFGEDYTYKLLSNFSSSKVKNFVIYDNLNGYQMNNQNKMTKIADDDAWYGTLKSIDTTHAESQGYKVKIYYSNKENAGTLDEDTSWNEYNENIDKSQIKSLAFQYLDSSDNSAIINSGSSTYVEITMSAPDKTTTNVKTYNSSWTRWNVIDENGNISQTSTGISSNIIKLNLPIPVTTKYLEYGTNKEIVPSKIKYYNYNDEYSPEEDEAIPSKYKLYEINGDNPTGTITKSSYEIIYYYKVQNGKITIHHYLEGTTTKIKEDEELIYEYGTYYNLVSPSTENTNYNLVNHTGETEGTIIGDVEITYYYNYKKGTITVHHYKYGTTEKVFEDEEKEYNYGEEYKTNKIIDENSYYEYYSHIGEETGTVNNNKIIIYYYKLKKGTITIHHYLEGTTTKLVEDEINNYEYGTYYQTNSSPKIDNKYEFESVIGNTSGTVTGNIEITYYYKLKKGTITVHHYKYGTTEKVFEDEEKEYNYGEEYKTNKIIDENSYYEYYSHTGEETGTVNSDIEVIYYYKLKTGKLIVHHYLEGTTTKLVDDEIKELEYGKSYKSNLSDKIDKKYKFVEVNGEESGIIEDKIIEITYYYAIKTGTVTVHHYIEGTTTKLADDVIKGYNYGENYSTEISSKINEYYELASIDGTPNGTFEEDLEIIYYYKLKIGTITVHHYIEGTTTKLGEDEIIKLEYGNIYTTNKLSNLDNNYEYSKVIGNEFGTVTGDEEITYYYKLKKGTITVHHYLLDTNKSISPDEIYDIEYTKEYKTNYLLLDKYEYNKTIGETEGIVNGNIEITYYYTIKKGKVIVHYYKEGTTIELLPTISKEYEYGSTYETNSENINNYNCIDKTDNYIGIVDKKEIEVIYYYREIDTEFDTILNTSNKTEYTSRDSLISYEYSYKTNYKTAANTIKVEVTSYLEYKIDITKSNLDGGIYNEEQNTITWIKEYNNDGNEIEDKYNIELYYEDVDINKNINNKVTVKTYIGESEKESNDKLTTVVKIPSKVIVKYIDLENNTIKEDRVYEGYVNEDCLIDRENIDNYELITPYEKIIFKEKDQTIYLKYKSLIDKNESSEVENPNTNSLSKIINIFIISIISMIALVVYKNKRITKYSTN